jgi:hypothetical protein
VDGQVVKEFAFDANPPKDPSVKPLYKSTDYVTAYHIDKYQAIFDTACAVDVPAGKHTIILDVSTGDGLSTNWYTFTRQRRNRCDTVSVYGSVCPDYALLWLQNSDHNWRNVYANNPIPTIRGARTRLRELSPGRYDVNYIDTSTGDIIRVDHERSTVADGLALNLPDISSDVAVKIAPAAH